MVTIKKIEIKSYFGKGDFEWELDPVVNILGGKNGSGKSTMFKLCYSMLSQKEIDDSIDKNFQKLFKLATITLSNGWTLTWNHPKREGSVNLHVGQFGATLGPTITTETAFIADETGRKRNYDELHQLAEVLMINSFEQHVTKATQYAQQPKALPLDDPTMLDLMIKDQIDLRNKDFSSAMEEFVDSDNDSKRSKYVKTYKQIYSILGHFLQGYDNSFKSTFEFTKNSQKFGYEHLSMGEKQILLLLLMVSNTNQRPCIFFMDEPDLSMHIDWKEILVKELHELNPNMQIILSTHAPSVITGWHDRVKEVDQLIK